MPFPALLDSRKGRSSSSFSKLTHCYKFIRISWDRLVSSMICSWSLIFGGDSFSYLEMIDCTEN